MLLDKISKAIIDKGGKAYLVGGTARDVLTQRENKDVDIEVFDLSMREIMEAVGGITRFNLVGKSFPILHTRDKELDLSIDISIALPLDFPFPKEVNIDSKFNVTVENAMRRRDFTINSLYLNMQNKQIVDYFNGADHIRNKYLDIIDETTFIQDPLRVLRGMQLQSRYKLRVSDTLCYVAKPLSLRYNEIPKERVWGEWYKWATQGRQLETTLKYLRDTDWLWLYPELDGIRDVPQDSEWHPEGDVFNHTSLALNCIRELARIERIKADDRAVLVFAILCHDLGKATTTKKIDGRWRALGHDKESVRLTKEFLNRINCPSKIKDRVVPLVENHMFPLLDNEFSRRQVRRLKSRLEPATIQELFYVMTADKASTGYNNDIQIAEQGIKLLSLEKEINDTVQPILTGRHILDAGIEEGKEIGRIKREAFEAQLEEEFTDEVGALSWLENYLRVINV